MAHAPQTAHHPDHGHGAHGDAGHEEHPEHIGHDYTTTGLNHRKMLMWVFLGSDCLFFGSLIATYMVYRGQSLQGPYPIDIIDIPITTISTFVLLCSSFAMVRALSATNENNQTGIKVWLLATAVLGAIFHRVPGLRVQPVQERGADAGAEPVRRHFLHIDRVSRSSRNTGNHLAAGAVHYLVQGTAASGHGAGCGNLRPVLALCRHRMDRNLHPSVPGGRL